MNISMPWPVAQQYRPDTRTDEINRRVAMFAALTRTGTTLERLQFARWRIAPDLRNRVLRVRP